MLKLTFSLPPRRRGFYQEIVIAAIENSFHISANSTLNDYRKISFSLIDIKDGTIIKYSNKGYLRLPIEGSSEHLSRQHDRGKNKKAKRG